MRNLLSSSYRPLADNEESVTLLSLRNDGSDDDLREKGKLSQSLPFLFLQLIMKQSSIHLGVALGRLSGLDRKG